MLRTRIFAAVLILLVVGIGYALFASQTNPASVWARFPFKLGLDLAGGTELVYKADTSKIAPGDINDSMNTLRDVIERRVNIFGVSEPLVQVEQASALAGTGEHRLIVELPGVTDIDQAIALIGKTPLLEFKLLKKEKEAEFANATATSTIGEFFTDTGLSGRLLEKSELQFNQTTGAATVGLTFNAEGKALFAQITKAHLKEVLAIFLDGQIISFPTIQSEISDGKAEISGNFTATEARELVRNLNYGSLPVPIELVGTQTIGPSLGEAAFHAGVRAGVIGFLVVALFLILWYRLPGVVASLSLVMYIVISLAAFKLIPVTLTAAGLAGFILSIGMAVDANILIFERLKEELSYGKPLGEAMKEGFHRAWLSIRDSNISSMITALVLFWVGTSAVKGFALTFGLGVLISMFTAITASRIFLYSIGMKRDNAFTRFLFSAGFHTGAAKSTADR